MLETAHEHLKTTEKTKIFNNNARANYNVPRAKKTKLISLNFHRKTVSTYM